MATRSSGTWEIEVQGTRLKNRKGRLRTNLRLWSDHICIADILKRSTFEAEHCHRLGEKIVINGRLTDRIARRHYAAFRNLEVADAESISNWLIEVQKDIISNDEILIGLRSGQIEGVIWMALFGDDLQSLPQIDPALVEEYLRNNVMFLFENYTDMDVDGLPRKTWLTSGSHKG